MEFTERSKEIYQKDNQYYYTKNNKSVSKKNLKKIHSLGIPPAYKKLWLTTSSKENIQAVALDSKNKKQYFYSPEWKNTRSQQKSERLKFFSQKLKKLHRILENDLSLPLGSKKNTMAHMIKIVECTSIRIGNKKYMDKNDSIGLTTLRKENVSFPGVSSVLFSFKGKHNVQQNIKITDKKLVQFIKKMYNLPSLWIMKYQGQNKEWYRVSAQDLNIYLQEALGNQFTIKDFRTHGANMTFFLTLQQLPLPVTSSETKKNIQKALQQTAEKLGNNAATSKKSYVMDYIIEQYTNEPESIIKQKGKANLYSLDIYQ